MDPLFEQRLLQAQNRQIPNKVSVRCNLTKEFCSDRFIPVRAKQLWSLNFENKNELKSSTSLFNSSSSSSSSFLQPPITSTSPQQSNTTQSASSTSKTSTDTTKDASVYVCLLRNELLGDNIEDLKDSLHQQENGQRVALGPKDTKNLLQYRTLYSPPSSCSSSSPPYSLSPVGTKSQRLLRSPRKAIRKIPRLPFKVLDAPELQDDFYLNLVDWSPANMLSVGLGSCVYLWSACTSQVTRLCDLVSETDSVTSVSWSDKPNLLAVGTHRGLVQIWDVSCNKKIISLCGHTGRVGALAWNGDLLASGSRDRLVLLRDTRSPSFFVDRTLPNHKQEVCGLKWSPDGQHLASGGNDNKLFVWNIRASEPLLTYSDHIAAVKAIAWSPHTHGLLASGGGTADRKIRFWNTITGRPLHHVDTGSQVCNLAWSKHSSELVSTHGYSQNQIIIWKYPSLIQVAKLTGHTLRVLYLAMSPDGESIVTGAGDETLRFWTVFNKARSTKDSTSALNLFKKIR